MAALDLTTKVNVKQYLNITDATDDALFDRLVTAQSRWFMNQVHRDIKQATYTENFSGDDDRVRSQAFVSPFLSTSVFDATGYGFALRLKEMPVVSITSVTIDGVAMAQATNLGQSTQTDGWVLHDSGRLELVGFRFTHGVKNCQVVYVAGYATVPEDIEQAVIELVAWRYREKDRVGQMSTTSGGETIAFSPYAAPQSVLTVIDAYRRVQV